MKRFIKSTIIVCIILITATSFAQSRYEQRRENPRAENMGIGGEDDQVYDTPIDDQIWLGLVAGVLIGGVMYYRRQKKIA